jgi:hypothetical protein
VANVVSWQTIDHFITYSVITASPQLTYSSVVSTIRLFPITSGSNEGHTFIQWSGNFSSDADAGELANEDCMIVDTDWVQVSSKMQSSSVARLWLILQRLLV